MCYNFTEDSTTFDIFFCFLFQGSLLTTFTRLSFVWLSASYNQAIIRTATGATRTWTWTAGAGTSAISRSWFWFTLELNKRFFDLPRSIHQKMFIVNSSATLLSQLFHFFCFTFSLFVIKEQIWQIVFVIIMEFFKSFCLNILFFYFFFYFFPFFL